jgi:hypothetical protein
MSIYLGISMKYLLLLLLPVLVFAQDFVFEMEYDSIPLEVDGYDVPVPWTGGYSYSHPALCDLDSDGDPDLFLGQVQGIISYFENQGTATIPSFSLIEEIWQGMDVGGHSGPSFQDLDADGDFDLVLESGNLQTSIWLNVGTPSIPLFELYIDTLKDEFGTPIDGTYGDFIDIDADGDLDFFTGAWYTGTVSYYENIGDTSSVVLSLVTSNLLGTNLNDFIKLKFCDIDDDSDYDLFIGDRYGHIQYFPNEGNPVIYNFGNQVVNWQGIDVGDYAAPEFCDIDGDGDLDLLIGKDNYNDYSTPGALHFWENTDSGFVEFTQTFLTFDAGLGNETDLCDIDLDGDLDLFFQTNMSLGWMENIGSSNSPSFRLETYNLLYVSPGSNDFADLNGDSLPDLITADSWGGILTYWVRNPQPEIVAFEEASTMQSGYLINEISLADMDADGDADLLLGGAETFPSNPRLVYYENQGSLQQPDFVMITDNYKNILPGLNLSSVVPTLCDVDLDSDFDLLFLDVSTSAVHLYENTGTPDSAQMVFVSDDFLGYDFYSPLMLDCGDIDQDGDMDVFGGAYMGGIIFLRNVADENEVGPRRPYIAYHGLDFSIGPNPANPVTWISFSLPAPQEATLAVYNILGAKVTTLASGLQMPGTHNYIWNASQYSSGLYIIRLETPQNTSSQRVITIK